MDDDKGSLQDAAAKALAGRAPFYGALNYGTSFSLLYTYSPLRDGGAYRTSFLTDLQDPSQGRTTKGAYGAPGRSRAVRGRPV